ncbi:MAG: serine hydrolase domain-containing protein [Bacteroidota bacterium]
MKYSLIALAFTVMAFSSLESIAQVKGHNTVLQKILDKACTKKNNTVVGISLSVKSPELGMDFKGSCGYDGIHKTTPVNVEQPFRIASLTKVFVASAILRLHEQQLISIEDPITKYVSDAHIKLLRDGGYIPEDITVRHCLNHTSGLYDYALGGEEYIAEAKKDEKKRWTRTEQIKFAMDNGKPHAPPGQEEHYSDTGYILLGEILERQTHSGLAESLRTLLKFDALGMSSTYLESLEARPEGLLPNVKRYMGELDASNWDNSVDLYGGGGLVSTSEDLTLFLQALFNGKIFEKDDTLDIMLLKKDYSPEGDVLPNQRLGFTSIIGEKTGLTVYLHTGFWGTVFIHLPKYNCSLAMNYTYDGDSEALQQTIDYVLEQGKKEMGK